MGFLTKMSLLILVLSVAAVSTWAKPNISELAHRCDALGKEKAGRELAKLAEHNKDTNVRIQAIERPNDDSVLSRIIQQELFPAVRQAAEARLKTSQTYFEISNQRSSAMLQVGGDDIGELVWRGEPGWNRIQAPGFN